MGLAVSCSSRRWNNEFFIVFDFYGSEGEMQEQYEKCASKMQTEADKLLAVQAQFKKVATEREEYFRSLFPGAAGKELQSTQIGKAIFSVFWSPLNHSISWC